MPPAETSSEIAPGTILAGKYRVDRLLGQGGMGVVVEARHLQLDERVALKFLTKEWATHPEAAERFMREARAAVRIKNEHVARVTDVGKLETGSPYMVMEYLDGTDLSNLLEKQGPMRLQEAVDYLVQGCEAIAEAHGMGIVHRDLKPANLFLTRHPDGSALVKVLDFGISKAMGQAVDSLTRTTATMGSALYMSPEQMQQSRNVDHRTDVYALGVTLYELLAGKQPYYAETLPQLCAEILTGTPTPLRDLRPDLPPEFAMVLERAYARDRNVRFQSVAEYVFALAPFAPPQSQDSIDRVARLAGQQPPRAGAPPAGGYQQHPVNPGGDRMMVGPYGQAPTSGRVAHAFAHPGAITGPGQHGPHGQPSYPDLGNAHGAPFPSGHNLNPGYQSSGSLGSHELASPPPARSKAPLIAAAGAAAVLGGIAAFFLLGGAPRKPATGGETTETASPATATPTTATPAPTPVEPPTPTSAAPDTPKAPGSAEPDASATPSAVAKANPPPPTTGSRPPGPRPPKATPPATPPPPKPPPPKPPKDVFGDR